MIRAWLVAALVLAPAPAAAASGEGGAGTLVWQVLNLLLLAGALVYFGRRPVQRYFAERRTGIRHNLKSAAELLDEAQGRLAQWEARMARLDEEMNDVRRTARERAEAERARILEEARASAARMREDARVAVAHELHRAREALRTEASELAVEVAGRMLAEQVTDRDRERLVDEFVVRIERGEETGDDGAGRAGG